MKAPSAAPTPPRGPRSAGVPGLAGAGCHCQTAQTVTDSVTVALADWQCSATASGTAAPAPGAAPAGDAGDSD